MRYLYLSDGENNAQYRTLLTDLLNEGIRVPSPQGEAAYRLPPVMLVYDLRSNTGDKDRIILPVPDRACKNMTFSAIGEIIGFINGAETVEELEKYGCNRSWWDPWTSREYLDHCELDLKTGSLGRGSYGVTLHDLPTPEGPFNQVRNVMEQIQELPFLRTHLMTTWSPPYVFRGKGKKRQVAVAPCHGTVINFSVDMEKNELSLHHVQRSGDVPVGVAGNIIQYVALLLMAAHLGGYKPGMYYHFILDPHMYERQRDPVKNYLEETKPTPFPKLVLKNTGITDIFAFRNTDFDLEGYIERPKIRIPTPI